MMHRFSLLWRGSLLLMAASAASGCGSNAPPVAETPPPPVTVSQPVAKDVINYDFYVGHIAAVETLDVRARVRGYLTKVNFKDGQIVKPGELLFEIDPRPYEASLDAAKALVKAAEGALKLAETEYRRTIPLAQTGAASQTELETWKAKQAVAAADKLKAEAAVEQAQLDFDFTKIFATIGGKISRPLVTQGNLVNAGGGETLLTTIVTVDPVYVYFDVDERALRNYRERSGNTRSDSPAAASGKDLRIPFSVGLEGEKRYPLQGFLDFAENRVNASTGTIQVRGVLPNPKRLLDPGMQARVRVPVSDPHKSLLITERAVGTDQGRRFVYVVTDQNVAERRDVELGPISDGLQVVLEGVNQEDWVIINGIQRVRDGAKVEPRRKPMPGTAADKTNLVSKN
jgi:RND family efflux transporter MFP subunit